ncbi:MAG: NAD(P)/FAD-dependent oxidoreductase [Alphaproteobacteria bacterium]|nr:NAD(P)/FAD-dependent oxidoreductase [Alphaproteobacteria bacterium]
MSTVDVAVDVAVVGAGPAGLAAAAEAAAFGLSVAIVDDNPRPGGQYYRHPPPAFRPAAAAPADKERRRREAAFAVLAHPEVKYLPNATAWNLPEPGVLAIAAGERSGRLAARAIVVAAGAHDRPAAFPGWTLPGVVSAGGMQNLFKSQLIVPGTRAVVAGNGPLLFLIASNLVRAGLRVEALVEAAPIGVRLPAALPLLAWSPRLLGAALSYRAALSRARANVLAGWSVTEAHGNGAVEGVTVAPIDGNGRVDASRARRFACDLLVTGFGLVPSVELPRLAGAVLDYDRRRGGWTVRRDRNLETTVPGLYVVGDGACIGGVDLAEVEGRIAAAAIADRLGPQPGARARRADLLARRARQDRFRRGIELLFAPPGDFLALLTPETVVCRCEDVTFAELEACRAEGAAGAAAIKARTRMTMGRCQGRYCAPTLAQFLARAGGVDVAAVPMPRPRAPARPVVLGDLAHEAIAPPVLPDDPHLPRAPRA